MQLMLQFTAFNIQSHSSCAFDYLNVTDGDGTTLLGKACGSTLPANITSSSNVINLFFKTNADGTASGWSVSWSVVTPGVCQKLNGKFLVISTSCPSCFKHLITCQSVRLLGAKHGLQDNETKKSGTASR